MIFQRRAAPVFGGALLPATKRLIYITGGVYLLQALAPTVTAIFGLIPPAVFRFEVWRLFTYMFLHGGLWHLLLNMLVLYMFGSQLEALWGSRRFTRFYVLSGVGAGLFTLIPLEAFFHANHIGASGAIYGLLLAFGMLFPEARVYVFLVLPMKARHLVVVLGFIALASSISATGDGVSHIAHLGGLVAGYVLLRRERLLPPGGLRFRFRRRWADLRRRQQRRRFDRFHERKRRRRRETLH